VQADGKILVAGEFYRLGGQARKYVGRLNGDGGVDPAFSIGASASVACVALQPDGKILVGGGFTTLGGQPRSGIGRLNNTTPATESLTVDGSTVTWLRGGSAPEALNARFDVFTPRAGWLDLGAGQRIAGGWQLTGTSLPPEATLRGRAFVTGGFDNGSGWLVETMIGPPPLALQINWDGYSPRLGVFGELGRQYTIEFSSALTLDSAWQPLSTFWLTDNPQTIPDFSTGGASQRFYRARSNP
jgi:hypothetical protein